MVFSLRLGSTAIDKEKKSKIFLILKLDKKRENAYFATQYAYHELQMVKKYLMSDRHLLICSYCTSICIYTISQSIVSHVMNSGGKINLT